MKQTFNVGYLQTPSVKNLENAKQALFESGLVENTTPDEMLPDAIEEGVKKLSAGGSAPVDNGPIYEGKYRVRYFDIDGTVLKIEYVANGGKTTPPDAPAYDPDYLIFDEWNYNTANYIVEQPTDIGAIYKTVDDATYMFCRFTTKTGLNPTLAISGFTSIDWGDGTIDTNTSHTYANEGNYVIKIFGNFICTATSSIYFLGASTYNHSLKKIYLYSGYNTVSYNFYECYTMEVISLPKSISLISSYCFNYCYKLKHLNVPKEINELGPYCCNDCYGLNHISINENELTIGASAFVNCYSLDYVKFSISSLGAQAFNNCRNVKYICLKNIKTITNSFSDTGAKIINIKTENTLRIEYFSIQYAENLILDTTLIPNLVSSSNFYVVNTNFIIWVNDTILEQLKVATNWSKFATQMKPLSQYPNL